MAMGMPVVTTPIGAENIDATDGVDWIIAEKDSDFIEAIVKLLNFNPTYRQKMGCLAQKFVRDNFTWEYAEHALKKVMS